MHFFAVGVARPLIFFNFSQKLYILFPLSLLIRIGVIPGCSRNILDDYGRTGFSSNFMVRKLDE